jgi:single-stranded-DNA-specific exonuclease
VINPCGKTSGLHVSTITECPASWDEIRAWIKKSYHLNQPLALAWSKPQNQPPHEVWYKLAGLAKYLARTQEPVTRIQLREKLGIGDQPLHLGLKALRHLGIKSTFNDRNLIFVESKKHQSNFVSAQSALEQFLAAVQEEQFQRAYFAEVPLSAVNAMAGRIFDS